ncbi:hypothetical protein KFE96_07275 [Kordiimonas sp. SCSIO 12603]|uniref:hypothetical protein n=1 Tax=Kordiimonas sp. SCSIO 12603 TaxID=2829596 RepID=UPI002102E042|nr:hypothetical protein [Kordiimonas sp. SCSIO 12603]UTW60103.1 hypothetical protein KFE96_07275 [Kordiimonas sp. SCSIO 12603]
MGIKRHSDRGLLGAFGLLLTGVIVSYLVFQYFDFDGEAAPTTLRSRLQWELILNLQILSLACVWFFFVDYLEGFKGFRRQAMKLRIYLGYIMVLMPLWIVLTAVANNWFVVRATQTEIHILIVVVIFVRLGFGLAIRYYNVLAEKANEPADKPVEFKDNYFDYVLYLGGSAFLVWCVYVDGYWHYVVLPFLFYLKASVAYVRLGRAIVKKKEA